MARAKKEEPHLNVILRQDIYERFCKYAGEKGQTKTKAIERILEKALDEEENEKK